MYEKPSPHVRWSWVGLLLAVAIPHIVVGGWLLWRLFPWLTLPFVALSVAAVLVLALWYLPQRRKNMRYVLGTQRVTVQSGVLFFTSRRMELNAVRQVTLLQGPIERRCRTAFLLISATGGYLLIGGIDRQKAEEWCKGRFPL